MGIRWRGIEEWRRGSAYGSAPGLGERQHEKTEWSAVPSDLLHFWGSKNLWSYWEQTYCKKGQQSLSFHCSMHQWADVWQRSLGGKREALTSICPSLWYQYFHHEQFQATNGLIRSSCNSWKLSNCLSQIVAGWFKQCTVYILLKCFKLFEKEIC